MITQPVPEVKLITQNFAISYCKEVTIPRALRIYRKGMSQKFDLYKAILPENFSADCKVNTQIIPNSSMFLLDKSEKVVYTVGGSGEKWDKREQKGQNLAFIPKISQRSTNFHYKDKGKAQNPRSFAS